MQSSPMRHFIQTRRFERTAQNAGMDDAAVLDLEADLRANPRAGATVGGTAGARKIRVARPGKGKSGGVRVLYVYAEQRDTVYLLLAFPKNVQGNLTSEQKQLLRKLIARLEAP